MAPVKSKQTDRRDAKKATKNPVDDEPVVQSGGAAQTLKILTELATGSCLAKLGPKAQALLKPEGAVAEEKKVEEKIVEGNENVDEDEKSEKPVEEKPLTAGAFFEKLQVWLVWHNCLGLAFPANGEDSLKAFKALIGLELDWGPRKSRKGSPSMDRIVANLNNNLPQYLHVLFVMMVLRCILFRSFFCLLPLLFGLQVASVMVPLSAAPQVETKFRVVGTLAIHALVVLFFLYEAVYKTYILEKLLGVGIFAFHMHSVKPVDA